LDYASQAQSEGVEALCYSNIVVSAKDSDERYIGSVSDSDIEISALKTLIAAANHAYIELHFKQQAQ